MSPNEIHNITIHVLLCTAQAHQSQSVVHGADIYADVLGLGVNYNVQCMFNIEGSGGSGSVTN